MLKNYSLIGMVLLLNIAGAGCQPRTTSEKVKDKIEDATHETKQGVERAKDRVKDATR